MGGTQVSQTSRTNNNEAKAETSVAVCVVWCVVLRVFWALSSVPMPHHVRHLRSIRITSSSSAWKGVAETHNIMCA